MATVAASFRGGWILLKTGTLQPGALNAYERLWGMNAEGVTVELDTNSVTTLTPVQIIQQWESTSGNVLRPLAFTDDEREGQRLRLGLDPVTSTVTLTPLPAIYGGSAGGDATSLQSVPISAAAPTVNDVLTFNGAEWEPLPPQVTVADNVSNVLFQLTAGSAAQFDPTPLEIDSPVNPQLTVGVGGLAISMDDTSPAGATVIFWIDTPIPWSRIRSIDVGVALFGGGPVDDFGFGVVVAGDGALGTGVELMMTRVVGPDTFLTGRTLNGLTAPGALFNVGVPDSETSILRFDFVQPGTDTSTFVPNGVPAFFGTAAIAGASGGNANGTQSPIFTAGGFAGTQWGPATLNQVGVVLYAPNGVTDPAGMTVGIPTLRVLGEGV